MPWARLDDNLTANPKILRLSDAAFRLYICGLVHCARQLTDGFIDEIVLPMLGARLKRSAFNEFERAGLWRRADGGGYQVRNYLEWNDSAEMVREKRRQRASVSTDTVTRSVTRYRTRLKRRLKQRPYHTTPFRSDL